MPSTTVSVLRDLQLTVRRADGTSATVDLDNGYLDYKSDPNRFDDLITASIAPELAKGRYGLIDTLFVYRRGKFVKFGRN